MVADVNIVRVKSGREEDFHRLRTQVQAATRSSRDVKSFTTFDVLRDVLDPSDPLYFDATNNELWMSTFESFEVREGSSSRSLRILSLKLFSHCSSTPSSASLVVSSPVIILPSTILPFPEMCPSMPQ